jgi:hypothetical protein
MFKSGKANAMYRKGTSFLDSTAKSLGGASGILRKGVDRAQTLVDKASHSKLGQEVLKTKEGQQISGLINKGLKIGGNVAGELDKASKVVGASLDSRATASRGLQKSKGPMMESAGPSFV